MTTEEALIALVRLLGALPVLRWPFYGGIVAVLVDLSDLFLMNLLDLGGVSDYQTFDKVLDQAYMLTFLVVALRWQGWPRTIAVALYAYRLIGFVAFELAGEREVLLLFPNFFEIWFLFIAGLKHFRLEERAGAPVLGVALAGLVAVKVFQEYAIHYRRWLDGFTATEAVESIWRFLVPW